jgi:hypothetical protein
MSANISELNISIQGRNQTTIWPTRKLTAFQRKAEIVKRKIEENKTATSPAWTCFWKVRDWISGRKECYSQYLEEPTLYFDRCIRKEVTKHSCVRAAYLTSTSKIGRWHFKHCWPLGAAYWNPKQRDTALKFSKTNKITEPVLDQSEKGKTNSGKWDSWSVTTVSIQALVRSVVFSTCHHKN